MEGKLLAKKDPNVPPILECISLCNMMLQSFPSGGEVYSPTLGVGYQLMTCFEQ